jgi:hypothetical protein
MGFLWCRCRYSDGDVGAKALLTVRRNGYLGSSASNTHILEIQHASGGVEPELLPSKRSPRRLFCFRLEQLRIVAQHPGRTELWTV